MKRNGKQVNCTDSELCTFLADLAAGYLPISDLDISQSVPSKSMSIASKSYRSGKQTVSFRGFPSIPMSINSMESRGEDSSTASAVDSPAQTSPVRGKVLASKVSKAVYGRNKRESFAKFDRDIFSWRTHQLSLLGGWILYSETFPRWGTMRNGELYLRQIASGVRESRFLIMNAKESGLLVSVADPEQIQSATKRLGTLTSSNKIRSDDFIEGRSLTPREFIQRFPTLHGFSKDGKSNGPSGNELGLAVNKSIRRLPTLTRGDADKWNRMTEQERIDKNQFVRLGNAVTDEDGTPAAGSLNPEWVEWLQGFPIGWSSVDLMSRERMQEWIDNRQWWMSEPEGIPRVAKGVKHCSRRIAGLGNAQVPECAAMAWKILSEVTD